MEGAKEPIGEIPPPFESPLPRHILAGRIKAIEGKVESCGEDPTKARRKARAEQLLEETKKTYREAGGGSAARSCFSLVNVTKQLHKLEKSVEKHQRELEERGGEVHAAVEAERRADAALKKVVREYENCKARRAYLAAQSAQEAGEAIHSFEGIRGAVESFRNLAQQVQRHEYIPQIDLLCRWACMLDPSTYCEDEDPLVLGVDVSEESGEADSLPSLESTESSGTEMEGIEADKRGRKRQHEAWSDRWETAEDRDRVAAEKEVREGQGELRRDTDTLRFAVEANKQIEEQERLQLQQDKEHELVLAAAQVEASLRGQGTNRWASGPPTKPSPNPRVDLAGARRRAHTPQESEATDEEEGTCLDAGERKKKAKNRRRKSGSRTPRGRSGHDTLDSVLSSIHTKVQFDRETEGSK